MQSVKTLYQRHLLETLNGRSVPKASWWHSGMNFRLQKTDGGKYKYHQVKKFIREYFKSKEYYPVAERRLNIASLNVNTEFFSRIFLRWFKLKLEKFIDISTFMTIPPVIKNNSNVLFLIQKYNKNIMPWKKRCPDCSKKEVIQKITEKFSKNLKNVIVLMRKMLVQSLHEKKGCALPNEQLLKTPKLPTYLEIEASYSFPFINHTRNYKQQMKPRYKTHSPCSDCLNRSQIMKESPTRASITHRSFLYTGLNNEKSIRALSTVEGSTNVEPPKPKKEFAFILLNNENSSDIETKCSDNTTSPDKNNVDSSSHRSELKNQSLQDCKRTNRKAQNEMKIEHAGLERKTRSKELTKLQSKAENIPHSTIDLSSNTAITIIPVHKHDEFKKKREILIKLENISLDVDAIKIRCIPPQSCVYSHDIKRYSIYFLKNLLRNDSCKNRLNFVKKGRPQRSHYDMTCPNKEYRPSPIKIFPKPSEQPDSSSPGASRSHPTEQTDELRGNKKRDCYYED